MKLSDIYARQKPVISFEFFPPKTPDGTENLFRNLALLSELKPAFVSMTYGAGGSTRNKTVTLVMRIKNEVGVESVAHLACGGHTADEIRSICTELEQGGIQNVLALRGDPPVGQTKFPNVPNGFKYASQLTKFLKQNFKFGIGVAGYPEKHLEAPSMELDLTHLKEKIDAGADVIITQLFFDNEDFFKFEQRVRALGIEKPIVAGIMPIKDVDQIKRFTTMCGAKIPPELLSRLEAVRDDKEKVVQVGVDHAYQQCAALIKRGVVGIHFYTLNQSRSTRDIFNRLKEAGLVEQQVSKK